MADLRNMHEVIIIIIICLGFIRVEIMHMMAVLLGFFNASLEYKI